MKIMFFLSSLSAGGLERVGLLLAQEMARQGNQVAIAVARNSGDFAEQFPDSAKLIDLQCVKPIRATYKLFKAIRSERPDAIIAFGMHVGIAAAISALLFGWKCPLLISNQNNMKAEWGGSNLLNRVIGPVLSRWVARRHKIVCVSNSLASATAAYLKVGLDQIVTIRNPVSIGMDPENPEDFLHPWLKEKSIPTLVAVGRLEYQKGFDTLIEALSIVRKTVSARLVIFGDGSLREKLERDVGAFGLSNVIDMPGFTRYPALQMREASAFVLSSRFEGFGLVVVEALLSGARVISTDCDFGPPEILENGRYGFLCRVDDPDGLAETIVRLLTEGLDSEIPSSDWRRQFSAQSVAISHMKVVSALLSPKKI
jgi:glycosyltransferase involved in cell wall biosynthesis